MMKAFLKNLSYQQWALVFIVLLFVIRLVGITHPPLEVNHHWRQVTGLMVARNFSEGQTDFFHPKIDEVGVGTHVSSGVIGMEFPLLNGLIVAVSSVMGYDHWYGRLINLIVSSFGLWFFFLIIKKYWNARFAFYATAILGTSVWFAFSRKTMPDTFSISIAFFSIYFLKKFLDESRGIHLLGYLILSALALLTKIPSAVILSVIPLMIYFSSISLRKKWQLTLVSTIPVAVAVFWYFVWNVNIAKESGMWYNVGEEIPKGWHLFIQESGTVAKHFYFSTLMSYIALAALVAGLIFMILKKEKKLQLAAGVITIFFILFALKSGRHFIFQHYYMIPIAPVFSLIAAFALVQLQRHWMAIVLLVAITIESIANQQHDFRIHQRNLYKLELEGILDKLGAKREDLIVINGEGNPQELYLSHRKGWTCVSTELNDAGYLKALEEAGAKFVVLKPNEWVESVPLSLIFENEHYRIYRFQ